MLIGYDGVLIRLRVIVCIDRAMLIGYGNRYVDRLHEGLTTA